MLHISRMGHHSTHTNGINIERPEGTNVYLFLLVKSPAFFEFTPEQILAGCKDPRRNNVSAKDSFFPTECEAAHPGLLRQYVDKPAFIIYTKGASQYYYSEQTYINDWILFDGPEAEDFLECLGMPLNTLTVLSSHTELSSMIRELEKEFHQTGSHHEAIMDARLKTIFYKYSDIYHLEIKLSDKLRNYRPSFNEIRNHIYSNTYLKKSVSELAEELNLSTSYFQHIYKELFGVSVVQDMIKSRIERACYLLSIKQDSIASIAESCGYENVEHFNRQFKEIIGCTPSQYKSD